MADLNTNLQRLQDNSNVIALAKTAIANAIIAKGGTVGANDGLENFATDINSIPSGGGGSATRKDVNFYDYDGTIVNSYTTAEFANLSEMPANPTHTGLTAQGWNWSLSDAKDYVASYGKLDIGQMYITTDNKTRIYIQLTEGRTSPMLNLYISQNGQVRVDWGDGSYDTLRNTSSTASFVAKRHEYQNEGTYVITLDPDSLIEIRGLSTSIGRLLNNGSETANSPDRAYIDSITKIELGRYIKLGENALCACYNLESITIPKYVSAGINISSHVFDKCYTLRFICIPDNVSAIPDYMCVYCFGLKNVSLPKNITSIGESSFAYDYSLKNVALPTDVTTIGTKALAYCYTICSIIIPNSVTTIGDDCFLADYSLAFIKIDNTSGAVSGSPWGATTSSPTNTQIIWLRT